jgi:hypothetical protein
MLKSENRQKIDPLFHSPDAKEFLKDIIDNHQDVNCEINDEQFKLAKVNSEMMVYDAFDMFYFLASLNLLNAAKKKDEFKEKIEYSDIKGNIARVITYCIKHNKNHFFEDFYINSEDKCAYVRSFNLQFSFHHITKNDTIRFFIESENNIIKPWDGIPLQKIAPLIFDLAFNLKFKS